MEAALAGFAFDEGAAAGAVWAERDRVQRAVVHAEALEFRLRDAVMFGNHAAFRVLYNCLLIIKI